MNAVRSLENVAAFWDHVARTEEERRGGSEQLGTRSAGDTRVTLTDTEMKVLDAVSSGARLPDLVSVTRMSVDDLLPVIKSLRERGFVEVWTNASGEKSLIATSRSGFWSGYVGGVWVGPAGSPYLPP